MEWEHNYRGLARILERSGAKTRSATFLNTAQIVESHALDLASLEELLEKCECPIAFTGIRTPEFL